MNEDFSIEDMEPVEDTLARISKAFTAAALANAYYALMVADFDTRPYLDHRKRLAAQRAAEKRQDEYLPLYLWDHTP